MGAFSILAVGAAVGVVGAAFAPPHSSPGSVWEYEWTTQLQDPSRSTKTPGLQGEDAGLRCRVALSAPESSLHALSVRGCRWLRAAPGGELLPVGADADSVPIETDFHEPFLLETFANGSLSHVWHAGESVESLNKCVMLQSADTANSH